MSEKFTFFWGGTFSQWHHSPFQVDNVHYNCAEQYMMAEKARLFGDTTREAMIMASTDPKDQKRYGRQVTNFNDSVWRANAKEIVKRGSAAKYAQNPEMMEKLLDTVGTIMVEASPWDKTWGIGLRSTNPKAQDRKTWEGTNWLGEILTEVRDEVLAERG